MVVKRLISIPTSIESTSTLLGQVRHVAPHVPLVDQDDLVAALPAVAPPALHHKRVEERGPCVLEREDVAAAVAEPSFQGGVHGGLRLQTEVLRGGVVVDPPENRGPRALLRPSKRPFEGQNVWQRSFFEAVWPIS